MNATRRTTLAAVLSTLAGAWCTGAQAEGNYPSKPKITLN